VQHELARTTDGPTDNNEISHPPRGLLATPLHAARVMSYFINVTILLGRSGAGVMLARQARQGHAERGTHCAIDQQL